MNDKLNNTANPAGGEGYIRIRVSTAKGAIPLENAEVTIRPSSKEDSGILFRVYTDADGLTPRLTLSAPPRENSTSPNQENPYAKYNIEVAIPGYYSQFYEEVPIFDGITAQQSAELSPLIKNGNTDNFTYDNLRFFEGEDPNL